MSDELTQLRARVATLEGVARKLIKRLDISTAAMEAYELYPIMRAVNESALASAKSALGEADTKPLVTECYCLSFDGPPIDPKTGHRPPCKFQAHGEADKSQGET